MPNNKLSDLRNHLFAALEGLADEENPMDLDRARTIAEVSKVIVDSAIVEVKFMAVTGEVTDSEFFPQPLLDGMRTKKAPMLRGER